MGKEKVSASVLDSPAVDNLLVLCEEVTRATSKGVQRFIEPAPSVLAFAKSKQHYIIFGRRGSGKSSLLRKTYNDLTIERRPTAFVDMETFKGHTYPDVLISVLIKSLQEFKKWMDSAATAPANRKSFWEKIIGALPIRAPFNRLKTAGLVKELDDIIDQLNAQLRAPESAAKQVTERTSAEGNIVAEISGEAGVTGAKAKSSLKSERKGTHSIEEQSSYTSHKIEYLHQNILRFQSFFESLSRLSEGPSFLILDDLYHIRRADQPKVIDYFHRIAKGHDLWLKIGTIKHRSEWYQHSDPPIGMKLGDDAKEINLDVSLEKFEILKTFLRKVLNNLMTESHPLTMKEIIIPTAIDRLVVASGGVTRDFIGIFSKAITQARNRELGSHRGPKVGTEDVNLATGDYDPIKREEFKLDTDEGRDSLEEEFQKIVRFCTEKSKCNIFLVSQKLSGPVRDAIDQLIDLRLIHPVKSRVTVKAGRTGELFEAYMLDVSQYTASRKVHDFQLVDLSESNTNEIIRRAALIYPDV